MLYEQPAAAPELGLADARHAACMGQRDGQHNRRPGSPCQRHKRTKAEDVNPTRTRRQPVGLAAGSVHDSDGVCMNATLFSMPAVARRGGWRRQGPLCPFLPMTDAPCAAAPSPYPGPDHTAPSETLEPQNPTHRTR